LPKKYKGKNLKPQKDRKISERLESDLRYFHPYYNKSIDTDIITGLLDSVLIDDGKDCREYVEINNRYYDVTNVPSGSNLVSISENNKMKVTSEGLKTDGKVVKTTSEFVNDKMKDIKNKEKELKESIKTENLNAMSDKLEDLQKSIDSGSNCGSDPSRIAKFLNEDK